MFHMNIRTAMLAGSTGLVKPGDVLQQDLSGAGVLSPDDDGGEDDYNLSKGGSLWED